MKKIWFSKIKEYLRLIELFIRSPSDCKWQMKSLRLWQESAPPEWVAHPEDINFIFDDRDKSAGKAHGHYFLQDLWAAQRVYALSPELHVDIGSRVDGFVSHVASFGMIEYVDIRKLECSVPNIRSRVGTIDKLPYPSYSQVSLSCLHVLEHIGLGRYGDPINPDGWITGLKELQRVLAPDGQLLLSTPCGRQRVEFNAHRIFQATQIVDKLDQLDLLEFSFIPDNKATAWIEHHPLVIDRSVDYGCGLFRFTRKLE